MSYLPLTLRYVHEQTEDRKLNWLDSLPNFIIYGWKCSIIAYT